MIFHPKDIVLIVYFIYTLPYIFINKIWFGLVAWCMLVPTIIWSRLYLAREEPFEAQPIVQYKHHILYIIYQYAIGFAMDILHILCAFYLYAEDGMIIKSAQLQFWDDAMKHVDAKLTGVNIDQGVGHYLRSLHSVQFDKILGEYLSLSYVLFYLVIVFGYFIPYWFAPRYSFDQITNGLFLTYIICLTLYPIFPTRGPFWTYPRPDDHDIGFIFGPLAQHLVKNNSALGTAFPSSHCAITTVVQILTLLYYTPLGVVFLSFCPAILVATVWLGYHYLIDAIIGFSIGCVCSCIIIFIVKFVYTPRDVYIRIMMKYTREDGYNLI